MSKFRIVSKTISRADKNLCKTWYFAKKEDNLSEENYKNLILQPILEFFDEDIESVYSQFRDVIYAGTSYTSVNVLVKLKSTCTTMYRVADMKAKIGTCLICPIARDIGNDILVRFFNRRYNGYDIHIMDVNPDEEYVKKFLPSE